MTSAQTGASQSSTYTYDSDGRRVKRNTGAGEVWQIYGLGGELLAEYAAGAPASQPQEEYGYRGGELLVTATVTGGWGPAPTLDDNPLVQRRTPIRLAHITQLRSAIDSLRSHLGLGGYVWSAAPHVGDPVTTAPITELRAAIDEALGPPPAPGYTGGLASTQPILAAHIQELRDRVLGAWQGGGSSVDIRWLVADQLGTPRMVIDKTGSLAGVRRHDYLPFGEELYANTGGRTTGQGYSGVDNVRQKFTGYERDGETNLDYAQARYYASTQGRFTSVDPLPASGQAVAPQTWNRYSYSLNNPLRIVDPTGMVGTDAGQQHQQPPPPSPPAAPSIPPISSVLPGSPDFVQQHPIPAGVQIYVPDTGFVSNEPFQGNYITGMEAVAQITVVDDKGVPIDEPFLIKEDVSAQLVVNGQPQPAKLKQNPDVELTENGFPDHINTTITTATPLSQYDAEVPKNTLATNHFEQTQTQTLNLLRDKAA